MFSEKKNSNKKNVNQRLPWADQAVEWPPFLSAAVPTHHVRSSSCPKAANYGIREILRPGKRKIAIQEIRQKGHHQFGCRAEIS